MPETFGGPEPQQPSTQEAGDVYLLGGKDLEMARIKHILEANKVPYIDKDLTQRQAANEGIGTYQYEVQEILESGQTPVGIELKDTLSVAGAEEIDHHGDKSERPASISQVLDRLGMSPNLGTRLIAANDRAYYPGMMEVINEELSRLEQKGYTQEKLEKSRATMLKMQELVRKADRKLTGVTEDEENEAESAVKQAEHRPSGLTVVQVAGDHYSPVADRLFMDWPDGRQKLTVVCNADKEEKEVWFFGNGKTCADLDAFYKQHRSERDTAGETVGNEYFTVSGGAGKGSPDQDAYAMVVARNPEEIINHIEAQLASVETGNNDG